MDSLNLNLPPKLEIAGRRKFNLHLTPGSIFLGPTAQ